jgi:DnaJ like chaperone protein
MAWWGKALGGAFGFMVGGPLGALMGVAFGHNFDRGMSGIDQSDWQSGGGGGGDQDRVQAAFFTATFSVMGYIAKADGKVTRDEIRLAEEVMRQLGLDGEMRESAKKLFNEGKSDDFPIDEILDQFRSELKRRTTLVQMFLEIQLQAAYADGVMVPSEEKVLAHICQRLGIPLAQLKRMEEMLKAGFGGQRQTSSAQTSLSDAYAIVGVNESASDADVKKAYRRLMSQHHPDKLVAKGLPDEMIKDATAKTQQIKSAYDQIKEARGG